jgi:hypothetical protein
MANEPGSVEAVAYALFERICYVEKKDIGVTERTAKDWERPSRSWILSTYAECLRTLSARQPKGGPAASEAHTDYAGHRQVPREAIMASDPI